MGFLIGLCLFVGIGMFAHNATMPRKQMLMVMTSVALITRLVFVFLWKIELASDFLFYFETASELAQVPLSEWASISLGTYFTVDWPSLTPFVLFEALIMKVFGVNVWSFLILNAIVSTVSCLLLFCIGERLSNLRVGFMASMLYALSPAVLTYIPVVSNQHVSLVLLLGALALLTCRHERFWVSSAIGAGVCLAVSQLLRPEMAVVVIAMPTACVWMMINQKQIPSFKNTLFQMGKIFLVVGVTYGLFLTVIDNVLLQNGMIEKSIQGSNLAYKLMVGLNQQSVGYWNAEDAVFFAQTPNEAWNVVLTRLARPLEVLILWIQKLTVNLTYYGNSFSIPHQTNYPNLYTFATQTGLAITQGYMVSIVICGVLQMIRKLRTLGQKHWQEGFLFWICAGYIAAFMLLETQMRYQMVTYPALMFFASQFLVPKLPDLHLCKENGKITENKRKELDG